MNNTIIQIRRSSGVAQPANNVLSTAEPAYSFLSDKLFIGNTTSGAIAIGGKFFVDQQNTIFAIANAAFDRANTGDTYADLAWDAANASFGAANAAYDQANTGGGAKYIANLAYDKANSSNYYAYLIDANTKSAYDWANTVYSSYAYPAYVAMPYAYDKANAANLLAYNTGIGANAFTSATIAGANTAVGDGANAFASATIAGANTAVGTGANSYAATVGSSANTYLLAVIAGANTAVGTGANTYLLSVISGANTAVGAGANAYADSIVAPAYNKANAANYYTWLVDANTKAAFDSANSVNTYSNGAYVKLTATQQTITGNLAVTGSLVVSGNAYTLDTETLRVSDPLIYLAGNNYVSDSVDIGFVGNYRSGASNLHTGLFRDATSKQYYLFKGYDKEPDSNDIDTTDGSFALDVLNANFVTSNLWLGGQNTITWLNSAYDKANAANLLAYNTGEGANAYLLSVIAGANSAVGTGANTYLLSVISGANTAVGTGANSYAATVGSSANTYLLATLTGANTAVGTGANSYAATVGSSANTYLLAVIAGANTAVGTGANTYLLSVIDGANTAVGTGANSYAATVGASANAYALAISGNASNLVSGTLAVAYGGTGVNTLANNGVLFGNETSPLRTTAAGTDGNVLQVNSHGTPFFGMLDGGTF